MTERRFPGRLLNDPPRKRQDLELLTKQHHDEGEELMDGNGGGDGSTPTAAGKRGRRGGRKRSPAQDHVIPMTKRSRSSTGEEIEETGVRCKYCDNSWFNKRGPNFTRILEHLVTVCPGIPMSIKAVLPQEHGRNKSRKVSKSPEVPLGHYTARDREPAIIIEAFLDLCCPFSKKMYKCLFKEVWPFFEATRPGQVKLIMHSLPQPWHPQSAMMHEASLAVKMLHPELFFNFCDAVFDIQEEFYDGNIYHKSFARIYEDLADIAAQIGAKKQAVLAALRKRTGNSGSDVTDSLKFYVKMARKRGVHVSPTVIVNGLEESNVASSWSRGQWQEYIEGYLK